MHLTDDFAEILNILNYILSRKIFFFSDKANFNAEIIKETGFTKSKYTLRRYLNGLVAMGLLRRESGKDCGIKGVQQAFTPTPALHQFLVSMANTFNHLINHHVEDEQLSELNLDVMERLSQMSREARGFQDRKNAME